MTSIYGSNYANYSHLFQLGRKAKKSLVGFWPQPTLHSAQRADGGGQIVKRVVIGQHSPRNSRPLRPSMRSSMRKLM